MRLSTTADFASQTATIPKTPQRVVVPRVPGPRPRAGLAHTLRHMPVAVWVGFDWALIAVSTYLAYALVVFGNPAYSWVVSPWTSGAAFWACFTAAGLIFGLYEPRTLQTRSSIVVRSALTLGVGTILAFAVIYVAFYADSSRWIGLSVVVTHLLVAVPVRLAANAVMETTPMNILCVGTRASVRKVVSLLVNGRGSSDHVVGHVLVPRADEQRLTQSRFVALTGYTSDREFQQLCPCIGAIDETAQLLRRHDIDQVIVDPDLASHPGVADAIMTSLEAGVRVTDQPTFTEKLHGEVPAEAIGTHWFLHADVTTGGGFDAVKRLIDVASAAVGLLLTLPAWPLLALIIKFDSPGPALFAQKRVGLNGRTFTIYKFRTMRADAERNGAQWAQERDPRVTRLGQFLRKSRIDEIPQFWNILRGDMSLVGPRPERPEFVEQLSRQIPHYRQRHLIKPGLTGWAQINYRYGASVEDAHRKLCYDLYYLKHRSIELDLAIIIRTIGTFLLGSR